jgi:hypothetical protein
MSGAPSLIITRVSSLESTCTTTATELGDFYLFVWDFIVVYIFPFLIILEQGPTMVQAK